MALSETQRDVIVRLRLDPTQMKEGYAQARQIQQAAQSEILALKAQEIRTRGELESRFTAEYVRQLRAGIAATTQGSAEKRAALVGEMQDYQNLTEKIRTLRLAIIQQQATAKEGALAASAFRQQGGASLFEQFGNRRILEGFTVGGALQGLGIFSLGTQLPEILKNIATGLRDAAISGAEYAHSLSLISEKTGISVPELQKLEGIGRIAGLSLDDLVIATRRFSAAMVGGEGVEEGLEGGTQRGAEALKLLGISARNQALQIRPMNEVLADLADVFARTPDGAEKSRIAVELFGRSGLNLIPLLNLGRKGFEEITAALDKYLPAVSDVTSKYEEYELAVAKSQGATEQLKIALSDILPWVIKSKEAWADLKKSIAEAFAGSFQLPSGEKLTNLGRKFFRERIAAFDVSQVDPGAAEATAKAHAGEEVERRNAEILAEFDKQKSAFGEALKRNDKEEMNRIVERVRSLQGQLLIDRDIVQELRKQSEELKEAARASAGLKDKEAERLKEYEKNVSKLDKDIRAATAKGATDLAEERLKSFLSPQGLLQNREQIAIRERAALQGQAIALRESGLSAEDALQENLRQQAELEKEIWKIRKERVQLAEKEAKETRQLLLEVNAEVQKDLGEQLKSMFILPLEFLVSQIPKAPLGAQPLNIFAGPADRLTALHEAGLISVQDEIAARKSTISNLETELAARVKNQDMSDKGIEALKKMNTLLREQHDLLAKLEKQTPFGHFTEALKEFGNIVGKFSGGLKGVFSEVFAGIEAIGAAMKQIQVLGGGTQATPGGPVSGGSFFGGIGKIFGGLSKGGNSGLLGSLTGILSLAGLGTGFAGLLAPVFGQQGFSSPGRGALSGALSTGLGAAGIAGLVGILTSAGAAGAGIGGMATAGIAGAFTGPFAPLVFGLIGLSSLFGLKGGKSAKNAQHIVAQIKDQFKEITKAFNEGTAGLATTIRELQDLRAKAVAGTRGGKKGNSQQMQQEIDAIDQQLSQLKRQQKQILDNFREQIGLFSLPSGARDTAKAIKDIAKAIKDAGDAGATAEEQIQFLNGAMDELKTKTAGGLRTDEQDTLNMLRQSVDLQKQRVDLETSYQDSVLNVRRQLGLAPALTPEQQAAKQLKDLKKQHDEQLTQLDDQQKMLKAQLDGRAELFGLSVKDLNVSTARATILDRQLVLERQITAETIARIQAQQAMFAQMAAGQIPALPSGVLPPGFTWPGGATYNQQITINLPLMPKNSDDFARIVSEGFRKINSGRRYGLE